MIMIIPFLNNKALESESLINYRPIYIQKLFYKIYEKILCNQLT